MHVDRKLEVAGQIATHFVPGLPGIIGAERARRRNGNEHSLGIEGFQQGRVKTHAARTGLPERSGAVAAQSGEFLPGVHAIGRAEQCGVLDADIYGIGIGERGFKMPDPSTLLQGRPVPSYHWCVPAHAPRGELVAMRCPGLAAVIGALDELPEPDA